MTVFVLFWLALLFSILFVLSVIARTIVAALNSIIVYGGELILKAGAMLGVFVVLSLAMEILGILFSDGFFAFFLFVILLVVIVGYLGIYIINIGVMAIGVAYKVLTVVLHYANLYFNELSFFFEEKSKKFLDVILKKIDRT